MTGSMYAAVSGLKAHMSALNVIGNNVSNVNTFGYKTTRYTFNEALYTTQRTGSDGTDILGGRNPAQVGFGASIGTIDLDMSTKNYSPTSNALDTMIDGDGFFMVGDKVVGADNKSYISTDDEPTLKGMNLTRLGNFNIDPNGYLVDGNGSVVWGFVATQADQAYYTSGDDLGKPAPVGTDGTLTDATNAKKLTDMTAADVEKLNTARKKAGLPELINVEYEPRKYADDYTFTNDDLPVVSSKSGYGVDASGNMVMFAKSASIASASLSAIRLPLVKTVERETTTGGTGNNAGDGEVTTTKTVTTAWPTTTLEDAGEVGTVREADQANPGTTVNTTYARMESDATSIDEKTGALRIMTSDGTLFTVGYLAIAKVTNPNGVTHVDGRYYQAQDGAGKMRVTSVGGVVAGTETAGDTALLTGGLESSGTDLATEITNMITVQRGYQANTRIVTVTDSMLEELVNMKR